MSAQSECKKLTIDPGVHLLAGLVDQLTARLDACCPPTGSVAAPAAEPAVAPEAKHAKAGKQANKK